MSQSLRWQGRRQRDHVAPAGPGLEGGGALDRVDGDGAHARRRDHDAADHADGSLEQMALSPNSLSLMVAAKILAHWLLSGLPLVLLAPILGLQFDLSANALWVLTLSLLIGTPVLSLIGSIGAALTLGVRGGDVLLTLLVLPLYVPALVFGAGAVQAEISGLGASAHLSILAAMALIAAVFSPWASAASLRVALES